jgi:tetratricopeptide (TPR) repeat protein
MSRALKITLASFLLSCAALYAQTVYYGDGNTIATNSGNPAATVATTPEQLRRVPPPSPSASAQELEEQADSLRNEKAYADAIDYYRAAIRKVPNAALYNKMGMAELQMVRYEEARRCFEKAVKLDPENAIPRNNLGVTYYVRKNYGKAIKSYEQAIKLDGTSASFHSNLGTTYFAKKQYEKASAEYLKALEIDPDIFLRRSATGVSMHMTTSSDRARYHYVIARMYANKGDAENCLLYLRKAIEDGYPVAKEVYKESEFANIRKDPRFTELMAEKIVAIPN